MLVNRAFVLFVMMSCLVLVSSSSAQTLRFDPDPYFPVDQQFTLPLLLEAAGLDVKGVECNITFDPYLVALESIAAGPWYTDSGREYFFWDYTTPSSVTIHFASAMLEGTSNADGAIAICHFSFVDFGFCDLIFTDADVRDLNNDPLSFALDNGLIVLDQVVETDPLVFAALKAIYR